MSRVHVLRALALGLCVALTWVAASIVALAIHDEDRAIIEAPTAADRTLTPTPGLQLLTQSEEVLVLELRTPNFQLGQAGVEGQSCALVQVAGYGETDQRGMPRLPGQGTLVGIPPGARVTLTVLSVDGSALAVDSEPCSVSDLPVEDEWVGPVPVSLAPLPEPAVPLGSALYPGVAAEIVSTGWIRSQRVAEVRFHPFQYDPLSGSLWHNERILVRLDFAGHEDQGRVARPSIEEGSFEQVLQGVIANYESARGWRSVPVLTATDPLPRFQGQPAYKVLVDRDGIYQVTYDDLLAAGAPVDSLDPRTLRLDDQGQEVALYVAGEDDGSFDSGDYVLFYGRKMGTIYTDTRGYWLTWGAGSGRRMAGIDGSPGGSAPVPLSFGTTLRWEQDLVYQTWVPGGDERDDWFAASVFASGSPASKTFEFTIDALSSEPYSPTLRGMLFGSSYFSASPDHHTRIYLNGHLVDDATWDGWTDYQFQATVPQTWLVEGTNRIAVECPGDLPDGASYDLVYVDWFEGGYRRPYAASGDLLYFDGGDAGTWEYHVSGFSTAAVELYDIAVPLSPVRIDGAQVTASGGTFTLAFEQTIGGERRYLALAAAQRLRPLSIAADVPSDLRSPANGADYIAITHGDFYTAVQPLAAYRAAQGLRTAVVDVQDIYDEFSYGAFDPRAIRDFLSYAYANWQPPAPAYVLLVGDGNFDFKDNLGWGEPSYVPPYLADVDPWIGRTAADNRYVCVSGDDVFPDMHLGRLTARIEAEAASMVAKILKYEQHPPAGDWNREVLFVADNAEAATDFAALSNTIADNWLPSPYETDKIYYGLTHPTATEARAAIVAASNEGRRLGNYVGHGSTQLWAAEGIFRNADIASLNNPEMLPVMVPMTCADGYYIWPKPLTGDSSALAESLVRAAGRGAIASWSPTGYGLPAGHELLNIGLFEALFANDIARLGPATTQAKLHLYSQSGGFRDLLDTYLLFGDPALQVNVLKAELGIEKRVTPMAPLQPGAPLTYTLSVINQGLATAHGIVITDLLPAIVSNPQVVSTNLDLTQRPGAHFAWNVADLAAGEGGQIVIRGTVEETAGAGSFENRAYVSTTSWEAGTLPNDAAVLSSVVPATVEHRVWLPLVFEEALP